MKSLKNLMAYVAVMAIAIASGCSKEQTPEPEPVNPDPITPEVTPEFAVDIKLDGDWVNLTVTPKDPEKYYFNYIMDEQILNEQYKGDQKLAAQSDIDKIINEFVEGWGGTKEEALSQMLVKGAGTQSFPVMGNKTYYCYVVYADMQSGKILGEPEFTAFESAKVEPSSNTFTIEAVETALMGFTYRVTPSIATDTYSCNVISVKEYQSSYSSLTEYADYIVNMSGIYASQYSGQSVNEASGLNPETEYMVVVFGYAHGVRTTEPTSITISTKSKGDPTKCTFDLNVKALNAFQLNVTVTPSDDTVAYYYDIAFGEDSAEDIKKNLFAALDKQIATGWPSSYAEYFQIWSCYGAEEDDITVNSNLKTYKVYAVAINTETGEFAGDMFFSDICTLPKHEPNNLNINVTIDKYFDGKDLALLDPAIYSGWAEEIAFFIPNVSIDNGTAESFYIQLYEYQPGYENNSDEWAIFALLESGYSFITEFYMPWTAEGYLMAVAIDSNGTFSRVFRQKVTLDRNGASPANEHPNYAQTGMAVQAQTQHRSTIIPDASIRKQKISIIR